MTDLERLMPLARIVRRACEKRFLDKTLSCKCYRVSLELFLLAKKRNIDIEIAGNYCHVFCLIGDDVIDLTATQFGHPDAISIGKANEWPEKINGTYNYWQVIWHGKDLEEVKKNSGWVLDCNHIEDEQFILEELNKEEDSQLVY